MYHPQFRITSDLLNGITQATELRAWIQQAVVAVPWLPNLQKETAAKLAHSSTAIEGNPLTLPEVEALARGEEIGTQERFKSEILNYLAAMRWIWKKTNPHSITEPALLELHRILTRNTLPPEQCGSYKSRPNRVVDGKGRLAYLPPPPEECPRLTRELLDWIGSEEAKQLHPVLLSAIVHHRLVSIHPFSDGNGRISRVLAVWILWTRGFDTQHLFALDEYYEEDRQKYYEKIQQARDLDDDLTYWLEYAARGIIETLKRTRSRIESLKITAQAPRFALTKRQEDVLRLLRDAGSIKSPDIEKAFKITRSRVGQILKPLVEAGLVLREGRTRATTYRLA